MHVSKKIPALVNTKDIQTKPCGKLIMVYYRGEILGLYPRNTPLTQVVATCLKRHSANTLG